MSRLDGGQNFEKIPAGRRYGAKLHLDSYKRMTNVDHLILEGRGPTSQHVMMTYSSVSTRTCLCFGRPVKLT